MTSCVILIDMNNNKKLIFKKEDIEKAVNSSTSLREVVDKIGKPINGFYVNRLRLEIENFGINTEHFEKNVTIHCQECNKPFIVMLHDKNKRKFCSLRCANQKVRGAAIQKNENDLIGEGKHRIICFRYHEKKCVVCGEDKIVGVHHYDENHDNDEPKNLVPICPTHHAYIHSKFRKLVEKKVNDYYKQFIGMEE